MLFAISSASFGCINAMLYQIFLFLGQLWQLFEVSQILEFLRYRQNPYMGDATEAIPPICKCLQSIMTVTNIGTEK